MTTVRYDDRQVEVANAPTSLLKLMVEEFQDLIEAEDFLGGQTERDFYQQQLDLVQEELEFRGEAPADLAKAKRIVAGAIAAYWRVHPEPANKPSDEELAQYAEGLAEHILGGLAVEGFGCRRIG